MSDINNLKNIVAQIPGWKTKKKIIVFQSDDWGSVRMPSREVYHNLLNKGLTFNNNDNYNKYDSIESDEDLEKLFNVLMSVKDAKGNYPNMTANCLMANPDFEKINSNGFLKYEYELVAETFKRYNNSDTLKKYWKEGNTNNIFSVQFHGREHLNTSLWMKALQQNKKETMAAFQQDFFGLYTDTTSNKRKHFLAAFDFDNEKELEVQQEILEDGLDLFEDTFGFKSESFIAPNYILNRKLNHTLKNNGVHFIQTQRFQIEPIVNNGYKNIFRYTGQQEEGLTYMVRNCYFEPSENNKIDWVQSCMKEISTSFLLSKPAIISTHRVNFISRLDKKNRDFSLNEFAKLLNAIIKKWPEIEFISTGELGRIMIKEN